MEIKITEKIVNHDINDKDITVKVVRNAIEKLVKHDFLAKDEAKARAKKGLLLTVVNYGVYQEPCNYKGKAKDKEEGKEGAKQGQRRGKARAINNNDINNAKNDDKPYIPIFEHWNSKGIIKHKKANQKMIGHINARLEDNSEDELKIAIDNYKTILDSEEYYWTHKWTLEDFMKPNNVVRFLNESEPLKVFRSNRAQPRTGTVKKGFESPIKYDNNEMDLEDY